MKVTLFSLIAVLGTALAGPIDQNKVGNETSTTEQAHSSRTATVANFLKVTGPFPYADFDQSQGHRLANVHAPYTYKKLGGLLHAGWNPDALGDINCARMQDPFENKYVREHCRKALGWFTVLNYVSMAGTFNQRNNWEFRALDKHRGKFIKGFVNIIEPFGLTASDILGAGLYDAVTNLKAANGY